MAITLRAAGAVSAAASGNITPALPTGWQNNDIALLIVASLDNVSLGTPAGWTLIDVVKTNGSGFQSAVYRRRLQTGDANPTVTHTAGNGISAYVIAWSGESLVGTGFDVLGAWRANASSTTCTADAVTLVNPNSMLIMVAAVGAKITLSGWSNSLSEDQDGPNTNSRPEVASAQHSEAGIGSTGSRTATVSGAGAINNGILIAIRQVQTASTTKNSDGRVKAQATTTKTSDARAKAQATTTKTSDGRVKVQASITKTSDTRAKAQASTTQLSDARAKAGASITKTSDGRVKQGASTSQSSDGRVRAQAAISRSSDGRVKAQASTTMLSDADVRSGGEITMLSDARVRRQAVATMFSNASVVAPSSGGGSSIAFAGALTAAAALAVQSQGPDPDEMKKKRQKAEDEFLGLLFGQGFFDE